MSRYIFTCWHFHFLRIARTAAVACYLPYHRSSPFQIVPLHYFLLENFNVFAPFKISIPFSRKHSESLSQTNEHLHAKLFLSHPPPPSQNRGSVLPQSLKPTPHPTQPPVNNHSRVCYCSKEMIIIIICTPIMTSTISTLCLVCEFDPSTRVGDGWLSFPCPIIFNR